MTRQAVSSADPLRRTTGFYGFASFVFRAARACASRLFEIGPPLVQQAIEEIAPHIQSATSGLTSGFLGWGGTIRSDGKRASLPAAIAADRQQYTRK
jgi:hypothetical protein